MKETYTKPKVVIMNVFTENCITANSANVTTKDNTINTEWQEEEQSHTIDW